MQVCRPDPNGTNLRNSAWEFLFSSLRAKHLIEKHIKNRRVLLLNGPRQCGKTTLAKLLVSKDVLYRTLDDLAVRTLAENDPQGFVQHPENNHTLIIDEIQRVPTLLSAIKRVVDEDTRPGQYLLAGSANIPSLPSVQESLAGRMTKIRLRPLTQGEIVGATPNFIERAFSGMTDVMTSLLVDRRSLLSLALRGGFPEAIKLPLEEREQWHHDYVSALLERDLRDIARITQHRNMQELVHTLAAWSGKFMDISAIGAGLSIRRPTIESYLNALEALYLVERVYPWTRTDYERVGKQAKIYMSDSGMMSAILRYRLDTIELDSDRPDKLIETFIFNELAALIDASQGKYQLFHYRDREKREIDFLIERDDQALLAIEIKAGSELKSFANRDDVIVLGLPRGGVPVAYEIAEALNVPLDVFIVRKLGVPGHEELAMGAIATGDVQVLNNSVIDDLNIPFSTVEAIVRAEHKEILRREREYRGDSGPIHIADKAVILVDDGIATGATIRAAIKALDKLNPRHLIVAVPVAEQTISARLVLMADEVITLLLPDFFNAVGAYYVNFDQTTDEEVRDLLAKNHKQRKSA